MNKSLVAVVGVLVLVVIVFVLSRTTLKPTEQKTVMDESPQSQSAKPLEQLEPYLITVTDTGFSPSELTVKKGGKVVWVNKSSKIVTLASADHPSHRKYPALNLGDFVKGTTVQLVFDTPGTYTYHNHLNPTQTGTVVVK